MAYRDISAFIREMGLPDGLRWYDCCGQIVFPIYGASGGISATYVGYILEDGVGNPTWDGQHLGLPGAGVRDYGCGWKLIAVALRPEAPDWMIMAAIMDAVKELRGAWMPPPNRTAMLLRYLPKIIQRKMKALWA